jgi:hypothetical protein
MALISGKGFMLLQLMVEGRKTSSARERGQSMRVVGLAL